MEIVDYLDEGFTCFAAGCHYNGEAEKGDQWQRCSHVCPRALELTNSHERSCTPRGEEEGETNYKSVPVTDTTIIKYRKGAKGTASEKQKTKNQTGTEKVS